MSKPCKKIDLWKAVIMAIASAVIASLPLFCGGCCVAIRGQLATWAAYPGKVPPDLPDWAPVNRDHAATRPADK